MTKKEIQEFTNIVMNAKLYRTDASYRTDMTKNDCYLFIYKTDTQNFQFCADGDTEEEARKFALSNILAKFRAMEPKKNWPKRVLDEPGLRSQKRMIEQKEYQEKVCLVNSLCENLNDKLQGEVYPVAYSDYVVSFKVKSKKDISFLKDLGIDVRTFHFSIALTVEIVQKINEYFRKNPNKKG